MVQQKLADKLLIVSVDLQNLMWGLKIIKHKAMPGPGRAPNMLLLSMVQQHFKRREHHSYSPRQVLFFNFGHENCLSNIFRILSQMNQKVEDIWKGGSQKIDKWMRLLERHNF